MHKSIRFAHLNGYTCNNKLSCYLHSTSCMSAAEAGAVAVAGVPWVAIGLVTWFDSPDESPLLVLLVLAHGPR